MATADTEQRAEQVKAAAQMFVSGFPLVCSLGDVARFSEGHCTVPLSAPWNEFGCARELLGPGTEVVSPNNDTLCVPAPEGDFQPILRMYQPTPAVLAGDYALPALTKVG